MSIGSIKRPQTQPPDVDFEADEDKRDADFERFRDFLRQLAQTTRLFMNGFQTTTQSLGSAGGIATVAITWISPFPNSTYSVSAVPSWATIVSYAAQTSTGITLNFATATPAGPASTVLIIAVGA